MIFEGLTPFKTVLLIHASIESTLGDPGSLYFQRGGQSEKAAASIQAPQKPCRPHFPTDSAVLFHTLKPCCIMLLLPSLIGAW